jgi:hypothetical protein
VKRLARLRIARLAGEHVALPTGRVGFDERIVGLRRQSARRGVVVRRLLIPSTQPFDMPQRQRCAGLAAGVLGLLEEAQRQIVVLPGALQPPALAVDMPQRQRCAGLARGEVGLAVDLDGLRVAIRRLVYGAVLALHLGQRHPAIAQMLLVVKLPEDRLRLHQCIYRAL